MECNIANGLDLQGNIAWLHVFIYYFIYYKVSLMASSTFGTLSFEVMSDHKHELRIKNILNLYF